MITFLMVSQKDRLGMIYLGRRFRPESGVQDLSWTSKSSEIRSKSSSVRLNRPQSGVQDLSWTSIYSLLAFLKLFFWTSIDFQKNNFTLYDPSPQIPYLKWARVRLNSEQILALIYLYRKYLARSCEFFWMSIYICNTANFEINRHG